MKKILLGTTALIGAVGFFAGAAVAETPKVTVGGWTDFQAGIASDDQDGVRAGPDGIVGNGDDLPGVSQRSHAFRNDTEITFKVDGKSDAGLGYGGEIALEADTTSDEDDQGFNASKTMIYLEGAGWGRFEMGSMVGAQGTMKVDAATIARATGGIDGDWYYFANNLNGVEYVVTPDLPLGYGQFVGGFGDEAQENVNKVTYYTPRWSGFQLGVSYMPNDRDRGQTIDRTDTNAARSEDIFAGGVNWQGKWDQVGITLAATGEFGDAEHADYEDLSAWNAGGKVTFAGFSVAGSYGSWDESNRLAATNADDTEYWTLGGAYEFGPFGASVTYLTSEYDNGPGVADNEFDNIVVGADYKLAPGLTPYAEVSFFDFDATGSDDDNDGTVVLVGTQLAF